MIFCKQIDINRRVIPVNQKLNQYSSGILLSRESLDRDVLELSERVSRIINKHYNA